MAIDVSLPHTSGRVFLTDGGLETDLIFLRGIDLPEFASFPLLDDPAQTAVLRDYFVDYLRLAAGSGLGLVLESPTWRASSEWGEILGYDADRLADVNRRAVELLIDLRSSEGSGDVVVSGCIGPRGDAYVDLGSMTPEEAEAYHGVQVGVLADAGADIVSAITLTNTAEAIGVVRAAQARAVPAVIGFTVELDGRLPTGMALADAMAEVDAATDAGAAYFMINCAHPDHFASTLAADGATLPRLGGVKANASRRSHAELDDSTELDIGEPAEFGSQLADLHARHPNITVLGGCCGTDIRHLAAVANAL
ncbi:homocysteine S-methyltransferase family protein [Aquihabitans sp. McL0605]|uniref:homocysteine S-methyltransferase family protein n=1 Tax=Aquihabitans sp. McL0605 TaxID=3415671 RepID=UPI003CEF79A1